MAVSATPYKESYAGDGVTKIRPVPFYFLADTDLLVSDVNTLVTPNVTTPLTLNVDYTVSGVGTPTGGTVTLTTATATGHNCTIVRHLDMSQPTHFVDGDPLPAAGLEQALDRNAMLIQQLQAEIDAATNFVDTTQLRTDLANPLLTKGASLLAYIAPYTGAVGTTQQQINNETVSVFRWFTPAQIADVTSGAGTIDVTAALQAALTNGNSLFMPDGAYLVSATLNLKSYQTLRFGANAFIKPAVNGLVVFLAYSATLGLPVQRLQIEKPYIIGNGKTGVVGFKLDNVSYGTAIKNARFTDIVTGIWLYRSCYGITMYSPFALRVPSPVLIGTLSCNGNSIISPEFDNTTNMSGTGAGDAVTIQGPSGSNTISGGYIQGYAHCITDSGTNNTFDGIYFEQASDAAVYLSACSGAVVSNCNHYGQGGSSMVKARSTYGCSVTNPKYTRGTGTLGLFDVDGTNSDFTAFIPAIPGVNTNLGTATGVKYFTNEVNAQNITTPISIFGSTAAGTGIVYDYNKLETSKIGSLLFFNFAVVWHGLTGATGDLHFTGLPFSAGSLYNLSQFSCNYSGNSLPANTAELTAGMANATTGRIQAVSYTGVLSNVPIAASGTLTVSGFIFTA